MIKRIGSLYTSESLPGKFYLTRKEIVAALKDEDLSELTDFSDFLEEGTNKKEEEKRKKLEEDRARLESMGAEQLYKIAEGEDYRWPAAEPIIAKDKIWAYSYCLNIINKGKDIGQRDRWPEAEAVIKTDPISAYNYAENIINGRWPEAEPTIAKNLVYAYSYCINVINKDTDEGHKVRWPEGEEVIRKDPKYAYFYAESIINGRWPKAEPTIRKSHDFWVKYINFLKEKGIEIE